jgi:hypothetical protein
VSSLHLRKPFGETIESLLAEQSLRVDIGPHQSGHDKIALEVSLLLGYLF